MVFKQRKSESSFAPEQIEEESPNPAPVEGEDSGVKVSSTMISINTLLLGMQNAEGEKKKKKKKRHDKRERLNTVVIPIQRHCK
jgi:hypothetical protein